MLKRGFKRATIGNIANQAHKGIGMAFTEK